LDPNSQYAAAGFSGGFQVPPAEPPKKKRRGVLIAAVTAVAVVGGGGGIWALTALGSSGGAASPVEAVEVMLNDLADFNLLKAAGHVAPSEQTIAQALMETTANLVGEIDYGEQANMKAFESAMDAMSIKFADLEIVSEPLATDVERTAITEGSVTIDADYDKLADALVELLDDTASLGLGDIGMTRSEIRDELQEALPITLGISELAAEAYVSDIFLVTVKEDGKWFTSLSLTAAQYLYEEAGLSNSALGDVIPADQKKGATTPEAAVGEFREAFNKMAATGDLRELAKALPTAESRFLAIYGPAIESDDLAYSLSELGISEFTATETANNGSYATLVMDRFIASFAYATNLELAREDSNWEFVFAGDGYGLAVTVDQISSQEITYDILVVDGYGETMGNGVLRVPAEGEFEFEYNYAGESIVADWDGQCLLLDLGSFGVEEVCDEALAQMMEETGVDQLASLPDFGELIGVTAIKDGDGKWYVSTLGSSLAWIGIAGVGYAVLAESFGSFYDGYGDSYDDYEDWDDWEDWEQELEELEDWEDWETRESVDEWPDGWSEEDQAVAVT
jgi:hypothetical protein